MQKNILYNLLEKRKEEQIPPTQCGAGQLWWRRGTVILINHHCSIDALGSSSVAWTTLSDFHSITERVLFTVQPLIHKAPPPFLPILCVFVCMIMCMWVCLCVHDHVCVSVCVKVIEEAHWRWNYIIRSSLECPVSLPWNAILWSSAIAPHHYIIRFTS